MGNYEDALEILYNNWKFHQSEYYMGELTKGIKVVVAKQPDVVMGYFKRLARHKGFNLDLFKRIQANLDYKGDSTPHRKALLKQTEGKSLIERCYAYIYLGYMHGEHKHKYSADQRHGTNDTHRADRNERASRSHSAGSNHRADRNCSTDRSHSATYIGQAIHQSDSLRTDDAMKVLKKLLEFDFPGQAEELCRRRIKKDSRSIFVEELIQLNNPSGELEQATLLYDTNPEAVPFAMELLDAIHLCKRHAIAAEICKKILLSTKYNEEIRAIATSCLARKLHYVQIELAIDTWKDLIMNYPEDGSFHSNLTSLLSSTGNLDQTITVWKGLANKLKNAKC